MRNCELSSREMYDKLVRVFSEFDEWTKKEIIEFTKFLKNDSVVLEVGCGWGRILKSLAPHCKKIIGIDNSDVEIKEAKFFLADVSNSEMFYEDGEKTHFPDDYFDVIILAGNTFGNLGDKKEKVINEITRILKESGKILLSVYANGAKDLRIKAYRDIGLKADLKEDGTVIFEGGLLSEEFSKQQLEIIFKKFGLKVQFVDINSIAMLCIVGR